MFDEINECLGERRVTDALKDEGSRLVEGHGHLSQRAGHMSWVSVSIM